MAGRQDVIQLPFRITDFNEDMIPLLNRNFAEVERLLGLLQGYVKQATGGGVADLPDSAAVWDRASNINPDGTFPTEKLTEKMVGLLNELQLADEAVTEAKLAVAAVTNNKIAADAVTEAKIATAAVTALKIANGSLELAKFASGLRPVQVVSSLPVLPHSDYPQGATVFLTSDNKLYRSTGTEWTTTVATSDLTDKLVGLAHDLQIADAAVTEAKVAVEAITNNKIAANAVTEQKIADASVTALKLANEAVTTEKLANNSVTDMKLAAGAVNEAKTNWSTHLIYIFTFCFLGGLLQWITI